MSDDELMFRYLTKITNFLNKVKFGERQIRLEITDAIGHHNEMSREGGYTLIEYDGW